jgi:hypothetical protein
MNAVDRSDQSLACHNIHRKCYRWWKVLFYHLVDMAIVNSFVFFQYRVEHEDIVELQRKNTYSMVDYREAIVRQICKLPDYDVPPVYSKAKHSANTHDFCTGHLPGTESTIRRNCFVCYKEGRGVGETCNYLLQSSTMQQVGIYTFLVLNIIVLMHGIVKHIFVQIVSFACNFPCLKIVIFKIQQKKLKKNTKK